jgi:hypothetical protein
VEGTDGRAGVVRAERLPLSRSLSRDIVDGGWSSSFCSGMVMHGGGWWGQVNGDNNNMVW